MSEPEAPLAAMSQLVAECAGNGDFAGAARHAGELLDRCRTTLGEHHPDVLELEVALATMHLQAGDRGSAYAAFERLIPNLIEVLGRDHVNTLAARHLLANRPRQAPLPSLAEWLRLFADEQRVLGPDHPSTLAARERIAEKRWEIGDLVGAMAEADMVLAARRRVFGDGHAETLGTRLLTAIWRGRAGDVPGAVAELEALAGESRERLGPEHVHTLTARHMLTLWAPGGVGAGAWKALADEEARLLGDDHPVTVASRQELARFKASAAGDQP
jgi:tetratricopeptide repeat protein